MKKMKFILFAVAAIATVSCAKEFTPEKSENNTSEINLIPMTFTAGAESAGSDDNAAQPAMVATRVALQSDGLSLHWVAKDQIKVFDGASNDLPAFVTENGGESVDFTGGVSVETGTYYALYPYSASATFGATAQTPKGYGNVIKTNLPSIQTAVDNGIDPNAFIAAAKSESGNNHFRFKTVCAFVKFQLSEADATNAVAVSLSGNDLGSLSGDIEIFFQQLSGENTIEAFGQTYVSNKMQDYVTLQGTFKPDTDYYFAIRSNNFAQGFTITIRYADGSSKYVTTKSPAPESVSRNTVMNLGKLNVKSGLPKDLYIAWQHGLDIKYDNVVVNKTMFPTAKLFTTAGTVSNNAVSFVNPGITVTIPNNPTSCVVAGRYSNQRATAKTPAKLLLNATTNENDTFILANMNVESASVDSYVMAVNGSSVFENIVFDNCFINYPQGNFPFLYCAAVSSGNSTGRNFKNIAIVNSEFALNKDGHVLIKSNASAALNLSYNNIKFYNNVFYSSSDLKNLKLADNANIVIDELTISKNSFINVYSTVNGAYLDAKQVAATLKIQDNYFHIPNYATVINGYSSVVNYGADKENVTDPQDLKQSNNHGYYGGTRPGSYLKLINQSNLTFNHPYNAGSAIYSDDNIAKGVFTNSGSYGAAR